MRLETIFKNRPSKPYNLTCVTARGQNFKRMTKLKKIEHLPTGKIHEVLFEKKNSYGNWFWVTAKKWIWAKDCNVIESDKSE